MDIEMIEKSVNGIGQSQSREYPGYNHPVPGFCAYVNDGKQSRTPPVHDRRSKTANNPCKHGCLRQGIYIKKVFA